MKHGGVRSKCRNLASLANCSKRSSTYEACILERNANSQQLVSNDIHVKIDIENENTVLTAFGFIIASKPPTRESFSDNVVVLILVSTKSPVEGILLLRATGNIHVQPRRVRKQFVS